MYFFIQGKMTLEMSCPVLSFVPPNWFVCARDQTQGMC